VAEKKGFPQREFERARSQTLIKVIGYRAQIETAGMGQMTVWIWECGHRHRTPQLAVACAERKQRWRRRREAL
jgi:hypothetical protein